MHALAECQLCSNIDVILNTFDPASFRIVGTRAASATAKEDANHAFGAVRAIHNARVRITTYVKAHRNETRSRVLEGRSKLQRCGDDRRRLRRELVLDRLVLGAERDVERGVLHAARAAGILNALHAGRDEVYESRQLGHLFV